MGFQPQVGKKSIIIVPRSIGTILDNTQETDVSEKRLAWNFNMQIVTRKATVPERNQMKMTYFSEDIICTQIICTPIH